MLNVRQINFGERPPRNNFHNTKISLKTDMSEVLTRCSSSDDQHSKAGDEPFSPCLLKSNRKLLFENAQPHVSKHKPKSSKKDKTKIQEKVEGPTKNISQLRKNQNGHKKDYRSKIKSELCKKFMENGHCKFGNNCDFAHGLDELKEKKHVNSLFKTQVCKNFLQNNCRFGDRCHFVHPVKSNQKSYKQALFENSIAMLNINLSKMKEPKFDIIESKFNRLSVFQ